MSHIHIVFQVLNFLSSDHPSLSKISHSDKLLLIFLAKHKGEKGIYPSQITLSKELNVTVRSIHNCIIRLQKLTLISVEKFNLKSYYTLNLPVDNSQTTGSQLPLEASFHQKPASELPEVLRQTTGSQLPPINTDNIKHKNNTERASASLSPRSLFEADEESKQVCKEYSLDLTEELGKYRAMKKKIEQNQFTFRKWLKDGHLYNLRLAATNRQEVKSTVKFWEKGNPEWHAHHNIPMEEEV